MTTIWKYELDSPDCVLEMPYGARILKVAYQHGTPKLWAHVDPRMPMEKRHIVTYATGADVPRIPGKYLDTIFTDKSMFVWHIFEEN